MNGSFGRRNILHLEIALEAVTEAHAAALSFGDRASAMRTAMTIDKLTRRLNDALIWSLAADVGGIRLGALYDPPRGAE